MMTLVEMQPVATPSSRKRIDLRADAAWIARVQRQADRLEISLSDYIRQATTRQVERDEESDPALQDAE